MNYHIAQSFFDAPPDSGAGIPGDHLLSYENNAGKPLEMQFSQGINGIMFRISTPTTMDVDATIKAYTQMNPGVNDTPIMTYSIHATNSGGTCATLANNPPQPCNTAQYLGIEGLPANIKSVVISSPDMAGFYIGTLYFDTSALGEVPEPATFILLGGALVGIVAVSRHRARR